MWLYFNKWRIFFAVKTSPNLIGITVKKYHNQETTEFLFKVPGVLFCTTGWFTDVPL
jgi:hypothetical protein